MNILSKEGWYSNEKLVEELFENGLPKNSNEISKVLIDEDLRDFGEPCILNLHRKEEGLFSGPCVLQLLRYRNVCVPRVKEEFGNNEQSSSIIRLFLTDGHISISAILLEPIPGINADTPPGTKILLTGNVTVEGLFLILEKSNVRVLGGRVDKLIEKWNVEKNMVRSEGFKKSSATGAPKWISFGKKGANIQQKTGLAKDFKANDAIQTNKKEDDGAEDEFAKNREQAIKDVKANEEQQVKVFARPNVAPPPPSEPKVYEPRIPKPREERKPMNKRRGRKNSEDEDDIVGDFPVAKPSAAPTLFDFMSGVVGPQSAPSHPPSTTLHQQKKTPAYDRNDRNDQNSGRGRDNAGPQRGSDRQHNNQQQNRGPSKSYQNQDRGTHNIQKGMERMSVGGGGSQSHNNRGNRNENGPKNFGNRGGNDQRGSNNQDHRRNDTGNQGNLPRSYNQNQNQGGQRFENRDAQSGSRNQNSSHGVQNNQYQNRNPAQNESRDVKRNQPPQQGQNRNFTSNEPRKDQRYPDQNSRNTQDSKFSGSTSVNKNTPREQEPQGNQNFRNNAHSNAAPIQQQPQQHRQFQPQPNPHHQNQGPQWKIGDKCLAPWDDGRLYPATIVEIYPNRICAIRYDEYGNLASIPIDVLLCV